MVVQIAQWVGVLMIGVSSALGFYMVIVTLISKKISQLAVGLAKVLLPSAMAVGAILLFYGRITEFSYGNYKLKTQAEADANEIAALRKRVEAHASTVDLVAQKASEVSQLVTELKVYRDFFSTYISAHNDDKKAFERLGVWAQDPQYPLKNEAYESWREFVYTPFDFLVSEHNIRWPDGVDPNTLPIQELKVIYATLPTPDRCNFFSYVCSTRKDIPKKQLMEFLVDVMRNDTSLHAVEEAGQCFSNQSSDGFWSLEISKHLKWWEENREKIQ